MHDPAAFHVHARPARAGPAERDPGLPRRIGRAKQTIAAERAKFQAEILAHPELLRLSDRPGEPVSRYTTRTVWEAEQHVLRAAGELDVNNDHDIGAARRSAIESSAKFATMTAEQLLKRPAIA